MIEFTWDEKKNASNIKNHDVSFEEAESVFYDVHALLIFDSDHSINEDRFVLLGANDNETILLICHTSEDEVTGLESIRIISARKASLKEQDQYYKSKTGVVK